VGAFGVVAASAQVHYQPATAPTVTAENADWFVAGEPVFFNGTVYYPAGARVHFRNYEMVRTGEYRGIPLYSRPTLEADNVVFVPLPGGVLQPYERRRDGDLAGTVGSTAPSFPTTRSFETTPSPMAVPQAPGAPVLGAVPEPVEQPVAMTPPPDSTPAPSAVGTAGRTPPRLPMQSFPRPTGVNDIYVDFQGARWFSTGPAVELDPSTMTAIGEHLGFTVYARGTGPAMTIFIPVTRDATKLVAGYSRKPR
jgi:hypothetical protein